PQLPRLDQTPLLDHLQPVGDVVVNRAFPVAERIPAGEAPPGLLRGAPRIELSVNLAEVAQARLDRRLRRLGARDVNELQILIGHRRSRTAQAARRRFSMSESIEAAFGFTTQNLGRKMRRDRKSTRLNSSHQI